MYAVTTDGGWSWFVWHAKNELPGWRCCDYAFIAHDLSVNGVGTMTPTGRAVAEYSGPEQKQARVLVTKDFGRHWLSPGD